MVLDMAKPKNKNSTIKPGTRGRAAARKLTLNVDILQVLTIDLSEIQFFVNHNPQSDGQNKKCKEMDELAKEDHTYHLYPEECRRHQGQWYLTLNMSGESGPIGLRSDFRAAVSIIKSSTPRVKQIS